MAGIAGCAVQIFAYGFSAHISNDSEGRKFWVFVCVMPLLLSIFSTYTTLYGFINAAVEKDARLTQSSDAKRQVIEELIRDNRVARNAIAQTNVDSIRKNTDSLERAMDVSSRSAQQDLNLLEKLDDHSKAVEEVTPFQVLSESRAALPLQPMCCASGLPCCSTYCPYWPLAFCSKNQMLSWISQ